MPTKLVVVCHVEPGSVQGHTIVPGFERTEGIVRALPLVLEFAERLNLPIGLALTPQALRLTNMDLAGHDLGLHLHPLDPALRELLHGELLPRHDCLGRYPPVEQALLLSRACDAFEDRIGRPPRLFVAGRWSENDATAALLGEQGFTHDASALPGHRSRCADWSRVPRLCQPYASGPGDNQARGRGALTYIPVYQGLWGHHLTPETLVDLGVSYFKAALHEARVGGADIVHIYFHSPLALEPQAMAAFQEVLEYGLDRLGLTYTSVPAVRPSLQARSRPFPPAYWSRIDLQLLKSFAGRRDIGTRLMGTPAPASPWDGISFEGVAEPPGPDVSLAPPKLR